MLILVVISFLLIILIGFILGQEKTAQQKIKIFVSQDVPDKLGLGQRISYQIRELLVTSERYTLANNIKEASAEIGLNSVSIRTSSSILGAAISVSFTFKPNELNYLFEHYLVYLPKGGNVKEEAENIIAILDEDHQKLKLKFRELIKIWVTGQYTILQGELKNKKDNFFFDYF